MVEFPSDFRKDAVPAKHGPTFFSTEQVRGERTAGGHIRHHDESESCGRTRVELLLRCGCRVLRPNVRRCDIVIRTRARCIGHDFAGNR